jgi:hypothetical protein
MFAVNDWAVDSKAEDFFRPASERDDKDSRKRGAAVLGGSNVVTGDVVIVQQVGTIRA